MHGGYNARKKRLMVGASAIHGLGVFALDDVEEGEFVIEFTGEVGGGEGGGETEGGGGWE
jgi:SET domain-containing protein